MASIGESSLFQTMYHSLQENQKKIEVSADNLARSSMPREKTQRIKEERILRSGQSFSSLLTLSHDRHLTSKKESGPFKVVSLKTDKVQETISGNSISPQEELREINEAYSQSYEMLSQHKSWSDRFLSTFNFLK